ncbi:protein FAM98A-like [Tigriopus californicus]|uniref:protein FAM98A-like n=1 Tax=Tigriopus californicus TaxID=6832 RepID=UPI0027DA1109|nr:protein FAM98A-like [Tigriopus californicus]
MAAAVASCLSLLNLDPTCPIEPTSLATLEWVTHQCLREKGLDPASSVDLTVALIAADFPLAALQPNLDDPQDRVWVLDHLLTELMATRLTRHPTPTDVSSDPPCRIRDACQALQCPTFNGQFMTRASKCAPTVSEPLLGQVLDARTWDRIESFSEKMAHEFQTRRNLLLTRLNATVHSFLWSESGQRHQTQIQRYLLSPDLCQWEFRAKTPADILAARTDLTWLAKVSGQAPRARIHGLTKVKIGRVPDRGGRAFEQAAPAPEMPPWQKRQQPEGGHHRGGRGSGYRGRGGGGRQHRGRGGKGRVQGAGWNR